MLKIKSNTNEFTIIFSEKIGKKKNAQKISFSLCSVQQPFFFSPSFLLVSASFFFFSASVFSFLFWRSSAPPSFFSFQLTCALFFSPKRFCLSPKYFFSLAQNIFASGQDTFSVQPKNLSLFVVQRLLLFVSFLPTFLFCL